MTKQKKHTIILKITDEEYELLEAGRKHAGVRELVRYILIQALRDAEIRRGLQTPNS